MTQETLIETVPCSVTSPTMTLTTEGGTVTITTEDIDIGDGTVITLTAAE